MRCGARGRFLQKAPQKTSWWVCANIPLNYNLSDKHKIYLPKRAFFEYDDYFFTRLFIIREFNTTVIDENDIAAAPIMGESDMPNRGKSAPAAMGIHTELYMSAQNRFCLMVRRVAREISSAARTSNRELFESITSAESMATSVPAPMAIDRKSVV